MLDPRSSGSISFILPRAVLSNTHLRFVLKSRSDFLSEPSRTIVRFSFILKAFSSLLYSPPTTRMTFRKLKSTTLIVNAQCDSRIGSDSIRHFLEAKRRPGIDRDSSDERLLMVRETSLAASAYIEFLSSAGREKKLVCCSASILTPVRETLLLERREKSLFMSEPRGKCLCEGKCSSQDRGRHLGVKTHRERAEDLIPTCTYSR